MNNELMKQEERAMQIALDQNIEVMRSKAQMMIDSKLMPTALNTAEKLITVAQMGKELGLPFNMAVHNIYIINGRPSLSVHAIAALLQNANINYQCVEDFVSVDAITAELATKDSKEITKRTTFLFKYLWNGEVQEQKYSMTMKEADIAGWTTKDTWVKMPK